MENQIQYFPTANWVTLQGSFTPEELREIAEEITENFKKIKEKQENLHGVQ